MKSKLVTIIHTLESNDIDPYKYDKNFNEHTIQLLKSGYRISEVYQMFIDNIRGK